MTKDIGQNITYLLGAGASYNALPVVREIPDELDIMINYIKSYQNDSRIRTTYSFSKAEKEIRHLRDHFSVDTLARKYWLLSHSNHQNEEYLRIKNLMTSLIIFKQLRQIKAFNTYINKDKRRFQRLDNRYDSFLSALLRDDLTLPENIKILSWNYDFQLETALNFYIKEPSIIKAGNELGIKYFKSEASTGSIIKLNGTGIFSDSKNSDLLFENYDDFAHEMFLTMLSDRWTNQTKDFYPLIHFAWEVGSEVAILNRERARDIVSESEYIIVIGYSFPIFNRRTDIEIFKNFKGKKIYIQDLPDRVEQIKNQLESIQIGLSNKCETQTNIEQFLIPNEFWTIKPPPSYSIYTGSR